MKIVDYNSFYHDTFRFHNYDDSHHFKLMFSPTTCDYVLVKSKSKRPKNEINPSVFNKPEYPQQQQPKIDDKKCLTCSKNNETSIYHTSALLYPYYE